MKTATASQTRTAARHAQDALREMWADGELTGTEYEAYRSGYEAIVKALDAGLLELAHALDAAMADVIANNA